MRVLRMQLGCVVGFLSFVNKIYGWASFSDAIDDAANVSQSKPSHAPFTSCSTTTTYSSPDL